MSAPAAASSTSAAALSNRWRLRQGAAIARAPAVHATRGLGRSVVAVAAGGDAPSKSGNADAAYMQECISLARTAWGKTDPNPMVGCVLVKDGKVLGRGFHPKAGEPHAEIFALRDAGLTVTTEGEPGAKEWMVVGSAARGATAYVSLEPCNHVGKAKMMLRARWAGRTPPCSRALVAAGVTKVVVGMEDPDPRVSGGGIRTLESAGIQVVVGVEEAECRELNRTFIERVTQQRLEE